MKEMWLNQDECTGCGLCEDVCPVGAIKMQEDENGFYFPSFSNKCINCDKCQKKCETRLKLVNQNDEMPPVYAAWSKDERTRFISTSGGVFPELAKYILSIDGYVAGALYDDNNNVIHSMIHDESELEALQQSKYVQSYSNHIYSSVKSILLEGKTVLFCGTPCQVAALKSMFDTQPDNLITVDFICRGVNSPKAFRSWISEMEIKEKAKIKRIWFKYKVGGWKSSPQRTRIDFINGKKCVIEGKKNAYMHGYLTSNLYMRNCCSHCAFKGVPRNADITLADFWGVDSRLDDDKGTSLVMLNSICGVDLFDIIKNNVFFESRDFKEILSGNKCFTNSVDIPSESQEFLAEIGSGNFSKILHKYTKETPRNWIRVRLKGIAYRIGIK